LVKGTVTTQFKILVWIGGFLQFLIGILLILLPDLILLDQMDLAYPYLNYTLLIIIVIIGWIDVIAGILSIILGFWGGILTKYDLDLPEVIQFRKTFIPESPRSTYISKSVFDYSWFDDIEFESDRGIFFFAAGVFNYFKEFEVKSLIELINQYLT